VPYNAVLPPKFVTLFAADVADENKHLVRCVSHCEERSDVAIPGQDAAIAPSRWIDDHLFGMAGQTIGPLISRVSFCRIASVKSRQARQVTAKAPGPPITSSV
jgi:hypothetical protein